jgi:hypothetical protein
MGGTTKRQAPAGAAHARLLLPSTQSGEEAARAPPYNIELK